VRLLFAHTSIVPDRMGGSERVVWQLARALGGRGHEVRIVVPRLTAAFPPSSTIDGVTIRRYRDPLSSSALAYAPSLLMAAAAVRAAARSWPPDVVHAHHGISGLGAAWAGWTPQCYTFYGPWHLEFLADVTGSGDLHRLKRWTRAVWIPGKARLARALERAAVRRIARIIVLSRFSAGQLEHIHPGAGLRTTIIPGGVDLERFVPAADRQAARAALGLPEAGPIVFTVRRLVPRMGLEGLLRAFTRLPQVHLVIGGTGMLRPRLEETTAHLGLAERVRFTGFIGEEQLPRFYQAADLVVLPSVALEGFGLIALEALACGTPVVATREAGVADVLAALQPSWLVPNREPETFARTVAAALARSAGDGALAARCRAHAARHGWERIAEAYETLYRSVPRLP
jgi:glycosyltransferase involved in cell wall biosynthesis